MSQNTLARSGDGGLGRRISQTAALLRQPMAPLIHGNHIHVGIVELFEQRNVTIGMVPQPMQKNNHSFGIRTLDTMTVTTKHREEMT